jgi:hypothetical protein
VGGREGGREGGGRRINTRRNFIPFARLLGNDPRDGEKTETESETSAARDGSSEGKGSPVALLSRPLFILFGLKVLQSPESSWRLASKGPFAPNDRPAIESSMAPDDERMGFNLCAEGEKFLPGTSSSGFSLRG